MALLIEIGSGFGMYVAFAYWRINDRKAEPAQAAAPAPAIAVAPAPAVQAAPAVRVAQTTQAAPAIEAAQARPRKRTRSSRPCRRRPAASAPTTTACTRGVPDSDVQRFYRERVVAAAETSSLTSTELYEEYCRWCEDNEKVPFAHPRVTREIGELGVKKERIGKRTRYFGIALRATSRREEDKKLPTPLPRAA